MKHTRFALAFFFLFAAVSCDSGENAPIAQTELLNNVMGSAPFNTLISGQLNTPEEAGVFFKRQIFVSYARPAFGETPALPSFEIRLQVFENGTIVLRDSDAEQHEVYMHLPGLTVEPGVYDVDTYNRLDGDEGNPSSFFALYQVHTGGQSATFYVRSGTVNITNVTDDVVEGSFTFVADEAHVFTYPTTESAQQGAFIPEAHVFDEPIRFNAAFRAERRLSRFQDDSVFEATVDGKSILGHAKVMAWRGMSHPTPFAEQLAPDSLMNQLSLQGFPELHPSGPELSLFYTRTPDALGPAPGAYDARTLFAVSTDSTNSPGFMPTYLVRNDDGSILSYTASSGSVVIQESTDEWIKGTFDIPFDGVIEVTNDELQTILQAREKGEKAYLDPRTPTPLAAPLRMTGEFSADLAYKLVQ